MSRLYAVIGLGRFGSSVARTLSELGHQVLAIDIDSEKVQRIAPHVTHAMTADVTDIEAMKSTGVRNVDVAIITIASDMRSSIVGAVVLKELGVKSMVAKAPDELHGKVLERLGAEKVVYPERDGGARLARMLTSSNIIDQLDLDPNFSILEMLAPPALWDRTLAGANLRARFGIHVMVIKSESGMRVAPGADDVIHEGDILVVLGSNEQLQRFKRV